MTEAELVTFFFEKANVRKKSCALAGEMIASFDRLARVGEDDLSSLEWPNTRGEMKKLFVGKDVKSVFNLIARVTWATSSENKAKELYQYAQEQKAIESLAEFFAVFVDSAVASVLANRLKSVSTMLNVSSGQLTAIASGAGVDGSVASAIVRTVQSYTSSDLTPDEQEKALLEYARSYETVGRAISVACFAQGLCIDGRVTSGIRQRLVRSLAQENWLFSPQPDTLARNIASILGLDAEEWDRVREISERICSMFDTRVTPKHRRVLSELWAEVEKVYFEKIPTKTAEAMETVNPFLVRPLFRSRTAAKAFAVGGKIASSLETVWGNLLERLFVAMSDKARMVGNGGVDVVVESDAYDIKSGPAVMNKDQVNVMQIKADLIEKDSTVPTLSSFRVALAYGREEQGFGTMAPYLKSREILPAREAWHAITGDWLAPEKVYALCALVADITGVPDAIGAANEPTSSDRAADESDEQAFEQMFTEAFDPPPNGEAMDAELASLQALRESLK